MMQKALTVTVSVGVVLNAAAFLFARKPTALCQLFFMLLVVVLLAVIVVDLILIPSLWNRHRLRAFIPFCVALLCLGFLLPSIFAGHMVRDRLFRSRLVQYEAVIRMMMDGSIKVNEELSEIQLPAEHADLAAITLAEKDSSGVLTVEFIIGLGFPVKHSGYLYRSEGTLEDWRHAARWPRWIRMDDHWYRISD